MLRIISLLISVAWAKAHNPQFVPLIDTPTETMGFMFTADWMLKAAVASPPVMVLMWVFKEYWESTKGDKKKIREDLDGLKQSFAEIRAMLGNDLDHKIERKIERAFDFYEKGRRSD